MSGMRTMALVAIVVTGAAIAALLFLERPSDPEAPSLAPAFEAAGRATQTADMLVAKVLPVGSMDEKELGDRIYESIRPWGVSDTPYVAYANNVLTYLAAHARKPFHYRLLLVREASPNAFALPGGVIIVTEGMAQLLETESQLASVLAHELGHVELGHCFQMVKFQLATERIAELPVGALADFLSRLVFRTSYSKTAEGEADDYAGKLLSSTVYDPCGEAEAFELLQSWILTVDPGGSGGFDPVRDYFSSHPDLSQRVRKHRNDAEQWWKREGSKRYVGLRNYTERVDHGTKVWEEEWVTGCAETTGGSRSSDASRAKLGPP